MIRLLFFAILLQVSSAHAFLIGNYDNQAIDYERETDVFVVGYAGEVGEQFLTTAITYARKAREQYPDRQLVFLTSNIEKDHTSSKYFKAYGMTALAFNADAFTAAMAMKELKKFKQIHTLHVSSHAALLNGIGLTDKSTDGRWSDKTPDMNKLRFTDDGYIVLHGCNTGFLQAPAWSRLIGVPVFGSLTATNFQRVYDDGHWWFDDAGLVPAGVSKLKTNSLAFAEPVACSKGACNRLKADYFTYNGFWGDFGGGGGLSFYKSFCDFQGVAKKDRQLYCQNAMRQFMQIWPSEISLSANSTFEEYKEVVKDFLCGTSKKGVIREECYTKLALSEVTPNLKFDNFQGTPLQCENYGPCDVTYTCESSSTVHNCVLSAPKNKNPSTMIDEYQDYLSAF